MVKEVESVKQKMKVTQLYLYVYCLGTLRLLIDNLAHL